MIQVSLLEERDLYHRMTDAEMDAINKTKQRLKRRHANDANSQNNSDGKED